MKLRAIVRWSFSKADKQQHAAAQSFARSGLSIRTISYVVYSSLAASSSSAPVTASPPKGVRHQPQPPRRSQP